MNKFTYYKGRQFNDYFIRVKGPAVEVFNFPGEVTIAGWIPSAHDTSTVTAADFERIGIRQLPSAARNASYTQTA
jgi:hypothetical protein